MCKKLMFLISIVLVLGLVGSASGEQYEWTNAYPWSVLWLSGQNWDPVAPFGGPGPDDEAWIREPAQGPVVDWNVEVDLIQGPQSREEDPAVTMLVLEDANMMVGNWEAREEEGQGILEIYGGLITVDDEMRVADHGGFVIKLYGGILNAGGFRISDETDATADITIEDGVFNARSFHVGDDGDGVVDISGGLLEVSDDVTFQCRESPSGVTLNISGGEMNVGGSFYADIENKGTAENAATINISGGLLSVADELSLPDYDEGHGFLNMTGGELVVGKLVIGRGESLQNLDGGVIDAGVLDDRGDFWMNITGGVMILDDDVTAAIEAYADAMKITAYGIPSRGDVMTDYDNINAGRTTVWAEAHFDRAWGPNPADKATGAAGRDLVMSWNAGDGAIKHHVFFSDNKAAVVAKLLAAYKGAQVGTTYEPGTLQLGKTYYWTITEEQLGAVFVDGWIWEFTVEESRVIDDMEEYTNNPNYIFDTWKDGCGDAEGMNGNGTGSCVELSLTRTHSGGQAMWYSYETYRDTGWERDANYAEATKTSDPPEDWLASGEAALALWFYGTKTNDSAPMWVVVNDGSSEAMHTYGAYGDDPDDIKKEEWTNWNIKLADLALGVDLTNVVSLSIGFGDRVTEVEGGKGVVYFDDIGLYPVRCVPMYVTDIVDLNDDCVTDWGDIKVLADLWTTDRR
ncbi:MAG TPA: hypothetical protein VMW16_07000 [Sedimentisphaerales bacterium]|nr:hypothetical protein [Sedimentisphaerales bacterium]